MPFSKPVKEERVRSKHATWAVVRPNAPEKRPFPVGVTRKQFEALVSIAQTLGVKPSRRGSVGQAPTVVQMIRLIAEGKLEVGWKQNIDAANPSDTNITNT